MANEVTIGIIGAIGVVTALIVPHEINQEEAQKRIDQATTKSVTCTVIERTIDSITGKGDTIRIKDTVKLPSEYKYNPPDYLAPEDMIEVTVRNVTRDSMLFIGRFQSDTSALLDVNVRLQPSLPPEKKE